MVHPHLEQAVSSCVYLSYNFINFEQLTLFFFSQTKHSHFVNFLIISERIRSGNDTTSSGTEGRRHLGREWLPPPEKATGEPIRPSDVSQNNLVFKKQSTAGEVGYGRLMIPSESAKGFLPEPKKTNGIYSTVPIRFYDEKGEIWSFGAKFDEFNQCYTIFSNWSNFVKRHGLQVGDSISLYCARSNLLYCAIETDKKWLPLKKRSPSGS